MSKVIARFEAAVREHEMRGCQHPDDWPGIEEEYARARDALHAALARKRKARRKDDGRGLVETCPF